MLAQAHATCPWPALTTQDGTGEDEWVDGMVFDSDGSLFVAGMSAGTWSAGDSVGEMQGNDRLTTLFISEDVGICFHSLRSNRRCISRGVLLFVIIRTMSAATS